MRRSRRVLAPLLALAVAGCSSSATPASPAPATATASPVAAAAPLRVGVLLPYTESDIDGDIGASQKKAADLYLKLHGGKLGGRDATFIYSSESIDVALDQTKIKILVEQEKADLILGGVNDTTAYALRAAVQTANIVYIDTSATSNAVTRALPDCAPSCSSKLVFRTSASAWQLSEPLGEWAARNGHRDFFLVSEDDTFGTESASAFSDGLAKQGGRTTGRTSAPQGNADWAKVIAAITAQPTKDVFVTFHTDDATAFLNAAGAAHLAAAGYRLYGPGPLTDVQVLSEVKEGAAGVITSDVWSTELDDRASRAFIDAFRAEYKDDESGAPLVPDTNAVEMWDTVQALDAALAATKGDARPVALVAALEHVTFAGARPGVSFDPDTHNLVEDVYIREVRSTGKGPVNAVIDRVRTVRDPGR